MGVAFSLTESHSANNIRRVSSVKDLPLEVCQSVKFHHQLVDCRVLLPQLLRQLAELRVAHLDVVVRFPISGGEPIRNTVIEATVGLGVGAGAFRSLLRVVTDFLQGSQHLLLFFR